MHSFAHSLSHPLARKEDSSSSSHFTVDTLIAFLLAALVAVLISGALVYNSMNTEIERLQSTQVASQQQSVQTNAFAACVENHSVGATSKCRAAAATFAANDPQPAAFNKAVAYIYTP